MKKDGSEKSGLGERLAAARTAVGLTLEKVAEHTGYKSKQAVGHWETEHSTPDANVLRTLCELYGVSADALLWKRVPAFLDRRLGLPEAVVKRIAELDEKQMAKLTKTIINRIDELTESDAETGSNGQTSKHRRA